jgi:hypothetical protein
MTIAVVMQPDPNHTLHQSGTLGGQRRGSVKQAEPGLPFQPSASTGGSRLVGIFGQSERIRRWLSQRSR